MNQNLLRETHRIVFLTGAGVSAESGLATFRGSHGLWENHRFEDVACPEAWHRDPGLVLRFYNERRKAVLEAQPNAAHRAIAALERNHTVRVVTQNVDDLHERAGTTLPLHLHGEIIRSRSTLHPSHTFPIQGSQLNLGDLCPFGSQLRPDIVWFGEPVPKMEEAAQVVASADTLIVVGTSLQVYPAASLVDFASSACRCFLVDPGECPSRILGRFEHLQGTACQQLPPLLHRLFGQESKPANSHG